MARKVLEIALYRLQRKNLSLFQAPRGSNHQVGQRRVGGNSSTLLKVCAKEGQHELGYSIGIVSERPVTAAG